MVLLTCRPEFQPPWGSRAYLVPLQRLPGQQVEAMITRVTRGKALPLEVTRQIVTRTDGVPLFVEELIKTILESRWLEERANHYEPIGSLPHLAIPATLHDALMARLDRLGAGKIVAQLGATIGRTFTYDLLRAVAPMDEGALGTCLSQLIDAELLYPRGVPPQVSYVFKHALIQETAYLSLLKSVRQQYHRRIAEALETRFGDIAVTQPELLAKHLAEASLSGRAVAYWQRAGQRAIDRSAYVEAISHLTKGLDALMSVPDDTERSRQELDLLSLLGLALVATRGQAHQDVEDVYVRARERCRQIGVSSQRFLMGLLSVYVVRAELQAAGDVAKELRELGERQRDAGLRIAGDFGVGHGAFLRGEFASASVHLEQAIAGYDSRRHHDLDLPSGFPADLGVFSRCFQAHTLWHLGDTDQSLRRMEEALALAEQLAHPYSRALALAYAAMLYQFRGEPHMVRESAEAALRLCHEQGFAYYLSWATIMQGWALTATGHAEAGIARMREGMSAMHATGAALRRPYYLALLATAYGQAGRAEEERNLLSEALTEAEQTGEHWSQAELHRLKGESLRRSNGGDVAAERCFHEAIAIAIRQQAKAVERRARSSLGS
jgi:predicted ATPase